MKKLVLLALISLPALSFAQILLINEIATTNTGYLDDQFSENPNWIEIINAYPSSVDIGGYTITDDTAVWNKWVMPTLVLSPGARKIIYLSGRNIGCFGCGGGVTWLHANFKNKPGEILAIYNPMGVLLDSVTIQPLHAGDVMARIPDSGSWCFSDVPTPNAANSGTCYSGYADEPLLLTAPGFYAGSVDVAFSGTGVHYATDGDWPDALSPLYTAPVNVTYSNIVRAVGTEAGKLPSAPVTGSFFIDETTLLPVVSLSANSCDMFDEGFSCIGAYDNVSGWFQNNPQIPISVEYFTADKTRKFVSDVKFEVAGNSSLYYYYQRGMQFTTDADFGSTHEMHYNIFNHDKSGIDSLHAFRVRACLDWGNSNARMKDLIFNRMALPTNAVAAGFQNVATFINGEYWGHYTAREELDQYFLRDNFGCNPDSVVLIRSGAGDVLWETCEVGQMSEYNDLYTFFLTHNMALPADYALAVEQVDVENWVDYMATQVYIDNEEMPYNLRFFKSHEPEIKWKFILWDASAGGQCESCYSSGLMYNSYGGQTREVIMFDKMLLNAEFKKYYINRYADLMNYYYTPARILGLIDSNKNEIDEEMLLQYARWGYPTTGAFNSAVNELKGVFDNRNYYQRNDVQNHFALAGQVTVTLDVYPPGAGYVKISTITPGPLPWSGVYFNGNPVTVTAIANPGYTFSNWTSNPFITDAAAMSFTNNISSNTTFTANFTGTPIANPIVISEINFNSDSTINSGDWIEIHNTSDVAINVGGYTFSNHYFYNKYHIPDGMIIPAHDYLVLAEDMYQFTAMHPAVTNVTGPVNFSLENSGDSITLLDVQNGIVSAFTFGDDYPWPLTADGFGRTMELITDTGDPNVPGSWIAGCIGGSPGTAFVPCGENPLVDEINYNSLVTADAGDWFELYNNSATAIDLSGFIIGDKTENTFTLPAGTTIAADNYLVFYQDAVKFNAAFPLVTNKVGPFNFGYSAEDDVIMIYEPDGKLFQSVGYIDQLPYPLSADGGGTALQLVDMAVNLNDPLNWMESCPDGTPGTAYIPCETGVLTAEAENVLHVYPNPANAYVNILLPEGVTGSAALMVADITGKIVYNTQKSLNGNITLNISGFSAGLYSVAIVHGGEKYVAMFVKD